MMIRCLLLLLYATVADMRHFNGGTIRWMPIDPYNNSSSVTISIAQSYWWSYLTITCATNVPITTSGRSGQNANLTCITDCSTDGNYSTNPINILTDCISASPSLGIMRSERSVNITLTAEAHFYLAYVGSAWSALNYPAKSGLEWSIVSFIDVHMRADGFINTPPVASVISPQYVIVNRTSQIKISVSDVNEGDDLRCRWSKYTSGYRRRKRSDEEERANHRYIAPINKKLMEDEEIIHTRKKRGCAGCGSGGCPFDCRCNCNDCDGNICTGTKCTIPSGCPVGATTVGTTTIDTPGTLKSTLSYTNRQPLDECGGICYPSSVPNGTILSNCTLSFTGLKSGVWYGIAIQVEDFIDTASLTPMSSVPVQFLIYVMPEPECPNAPIITPLTVCLEVTVGVPKNFNLSVLNLCSPNTTEIADIIVSQGIIGMQMSNLTQSPTNSSLSYVTMMWTPQANQIGLQQLCIIAFTDERVQSSQYCITFMVITSIEVCKTTTTTTTSTTATTTTTTTTTKTTTSVTTTTTSATTTTTSATTTTTSVTTTTTSVTTTTTSVTTTTTSVTTTTTSATTTTTSVTTTTTSVTTTTTSVTTTSTSTTTTTTITIITIGATTITSTPGTGPSWGLIAGISSLALPLALCSCCCLYRLLWSPAAKRRRQEEQEEEEEEEEDNRWGYGYLTSSTESMARTTTPNTSENVPIEVPKKSYQVYNVFSEKNSANIIGSTTDSNGSILVAMYNNTNARRANNVATHNTEQSLEMGNAWMQPLSPENSNIDILTTRRTTLANPSASNVSNMKATNESVHISHQLSNQENVTTFSSPSLNTGHFSGMQFPTESTFEIGQDHSFSRSLYNFKDWTHLYLFGHKRDTKMPRISKPP